MMGEPLTKGILALYGLVCEQAGLREYLNWPSLLISPPWRCFAIGGDDHLLLGPKKYCLAVTGRHLKSGSKLSSGKHGCSRLAVKYCERLLLVQPMLTYKYNYWDFDTFKMSHPFVDSIKVRLLSPLSTTVMTRDDHNAAIGKGTSLGTTFRYLPTYLDSKWRKIVRERFFLRMGSFLPRKGGRSPRLFNLLILPPALGGLGLYVDDEEFHYALQNAPLILKHLLLFREKTDLYADWQYNFDKGISILRKWLTYGSFRAYTSTTFEGEVVRNYDLEQAIRETLDCITYWDAIKLLTNEERNDMFVNDSIRLRGFMPIADVVLLLQKGYLFQNIILGISEQNSFKTMNLSRRFQKIWTIVERECYPMLSEKALDTTEDEILLDTSLCNAFKKDENRSAMYVQVDEILEIDYFSISDQRQITVRSSVLDRITDGLPLLGFKLSDVALY